MHVEVGILCILSAEARNGAEISPVDSATPMLTIARISLPCLTQFFNNGSNCLNRLKRLLQSNRVQILSSKQVSQDCRNEANLRG